MASPTKVRQSQKLVCQEAREMRVQTCLMLDAVKRKMDNVFAEANSISAEAEEIAKGQEFIERLDEASKELPENVLEEGDLGDELMVRQTDQTVQVLSEAPAAIRSHHNLFAQFQYKCVGLKDLVERVYERAEKVTGPDLLEQYRKDQALTGFKQSSKPVKPRVMGSKGAKTRRLGGSGRRN
eukprot:TRINITY_DN2033_c0_g1_i2.p1 TRINITY_DN2033_c0_g1~~TRINITY_DN2033_c0_g1_i2.p1  ORF type:complete len:182 (+),score=58.44 TRINITY_DN2033_c0_g1_i2:207-752(+)